MIDWGTGAYEHTAAELMPVAERLVAQAGITVDDRVLDLGCGTGNIALLAARTGAEVTAADPAQRLLDVARERFEAEDLDGDFVPVGAEDLPFGDGEFDVIISSFAVIFTADPERAAAQIVRVLDEDGRALISAWTATGPIFEAFGILGETLAALSPEGAPKRFAWGDPPTVAELFDHAGAAVETSEERTHTIPADSGEAFMSRFETHNPAGLAMKTALTAAGAYDEPRAKAVATLQAGLADGHIKTTYLVYTVTR